jgi:general stress protein YciG
MPDNKGGSSNRGFASMDEEKQREIASKGGRSVPDEERTFSKDPQMAAEAGRKGGESRGSGQQSDNDQSRQGQQQQGGQRSGQQNQSGDATHDEADDTDNKGGGQRR